MSAQCCVTGESMHLVKAAIAAAYLTVAMAAATATAATAATAATVGPREPRVTPNPSAPGTATTFDVFCGRDAVSATLFGTTLGLADLILMHSTATTKAGEFVVTVTLPASMTPGTYRPDFDCSNGFAGTTTLRVSAFPRQPPATGDGTTATQTGSVLEPIGYGLMGLGVLTAAIALRRGRVRPAGGTEVAAGQQSVSLGRHRHPVLRD
jgi:hypothetical protein